MREPEELYTMLGGDGAFTRDRLILLLLYHTGAGTMEQLLNSRAVPNPSYGSIRMKHLCSHGYVECRTGSIPSPFARGRGCDIYLITPSGRDYVLSSILDPNRIPDIHTRDREELFGEDHMQLLHSIGMLGLLYTLLPDWDCNTCSWETEAVIPGARMRPDSIYRHTGTEPYVYYIEEDTGTQRKEALQSKLDAYSEYLKGTLPTSHAEHTILFHINDLRALGGQLSVQVSPAPRLQKLDRQLASRYGSGYTVRADDPAIPAAYRCFLTPGMERYTQDDIRGMINQAKIKMEQVHDSRILAASRKHLDKRRALISSCSGLTQAWMQGVQTLLIPGRYDRPYLQVTQPFRYCRSLEPYIAGMLHYHRPERDGIRRTMNFPGNLYITVPYLLEGQQERDYLVIENISHDLSGICRIRCLLKTGFVSLLLLAETKEEAECLVNSQPPSDTIRGLYLMLYDSLWSAAPKLYRYTGETFYEMEEPL